MCLYFVPEDGRMARPKQTVGKYINGCTDFECCVCVDFEYGVCVDFECGVCLDFECGVCVN